MREVTRAEIQAWIDNRFGTPNTVNIKVYEDFYEFIKNGE
uniref:Uncharacterized protein n=1 Tax=viral metagenome TaxID=1070528 RepID=A0A6M3LSE9_9ZZZZ